MSYPDYPNNRLVVNNVDLTTEYGLVLADGYTLEPPSIKTYIVDIPGGNGSLDLTETFFGDTAYGNRKQEFTFYAINVQNFEQLKTTISNLLHGRSFSYTMTMDPEYTYRGRFSIASYQHSNSGMGIIGIVKIAIDADPFKFKPERILMVNAVGGKIVLIDSGRKRVQPKFEIDGFVTIIHDGKLVRLPTGTWTIDELHFTNGQNEVYLNSYQIRNLTWGTMRTNGTTWGEFKTQRLFEWYKSNGSGNIVYDIWNEVAVYTWENLSVSNWIDLSRLAEIPDNIAPVHVKYDWGDL